MLLAAPDTAEMLRSLRKLMVGGEELPLPVLEALAARNERRDPQHVWAD